MSIFDQFFVYQPEPCQDRDWAWLSGLPLEDVRFQAVDGHRNIFEVCTWREVRRYSVVYRVTRYNHAELGAQAGVQSP
jgi:hypothetical protein